MAAVALVTMKVVHKRNVEFSHNHKNTIISLTLVHLLNIKLSRGCNNIGHNEGGTQLNVESPHSSLVAAIALVTMKVVHNLMLNLLIAIITLTSLTLVHLLNIKLSHGCNSTGQSLRHGVSVLLFPGLEQSHHTLHGL